MKSDLVIFTSSPQDNSSLLFFLFTSSQRYLMHTRHTMTHINTGHSYSFEEPL